jgi:hypothetical protein
VVAVSLLTLRLARRLALPEPYGAAALFLVLSCQMFYASVARVGNDWLAIPLAIALCLALVELHEKPRFRAAAVLGGVLAGGLLTKAYFLALIPAAFGLVASQTLKRRLAVSSALAFGLVVLAVSGPWYGRNLFLSRSLMATVQTTAGVSPGGVLAALPEFPWIRALHALARDTLWTGNNSFTTFSAATIHGMLTLLAAGFVLYLRQARRSKPPSRELWLLGSGAVYVVGVIYAMLVTFVYTRGGVATGSWYSQAILPSLYCVLLCGLARGGRPGRIVAGALVALWSYVLCATYAVKLVPLYGGYEGPPRFGDLLRWYWQESGRLAEILATTSLAPAWALAAGTAAIVIVTLGLAIRICRQVATETSARESPPRAA